MTIARTTLPLTMFLTTLALSGCSSLLPERPPPARLFAPVTTPHSTSFGHTGVAVRLRPTHAPLHLREDIVWRRGEAEFGQYEQRRWTELPSTYVARSIEDALTGNGVEVTNRAGVPALGVELRRFEELIAPAHEAIVEVELELAAGERLLLKRKITAREEIGDEDPATVAVAIGRALDRVADETSRTVRSTLGGGSLGGSARVRPRSAPR